MADITNIQNMLSLLPARKQNSNKYTYGKVLNIAGCIKYIGAAFLSSVSALKSGCGYVTLASIDEVISSVSNMTPDLVYLQLKKSETGCISGENYIEKIESHDVISIGCGISTEDCVKSFFSKIIKNISDKQKIVIDADGINIVSSLKCEIPSNAIITPHSGELSRLLGVSSEIIDEKREYYAKITSEQFNCITVLKGSETIVTDGINIYKNKSGNSALSKAGSGDVLTGIIAGLMAQGAEPYNAAKLGVYLHGLTGDIASSYLTQYCVMASDLIEYLPKAYSQLLAAE